MSRQHFQARIQKVTGGPDPHPRPIKIIIYYKFLKYVLPRVQSSVKNVDDLKMSGPHQPAPHQLDGLFWIRA